MTNLLNSMICVVFDDVKCKWNCLNYCEIVSFFKTQLGTMENNENLMVIQELSKLFKIFDCSKFAIKTHNVIYNYTVLNIYQKL